jgi:hypothetical protein
MGQPDDPLAANASLTGSLTRSPVKRWIEDRGRPLNVQRLNSCAHHRTTGEPGQGVDGRLLCPVINKPGPNPPPGGLSQRRCGCGKTSLVAATHEFFRMTDRSNPLKPETTLVTAGRDTKAQKGFVNPPVVHGSTVLYPTAEDLHAHRGEFQYGRHGTPTTKALQEALMALEGPQCAGVGLAPSGWRRSPPPCSRC